MLRLFLLMSLLVVISSFSLNMCERPGRQLVPIVYETGGQKMNLRKMVYEATFEDDRIVIRPMRRRRKRSYIESVTRKTRHVWHELKENVRRVVAHFFTG